VEFKPTRLNESLALQAPLGRFQSRTKSYGKRERRIENSENSIKRISGEFEDFLRINRQLAEGTVERHMLKIKSSSKIRNSTH